MIIHPHIRLIAFAVILLASIVTASAQKEVYNINRRIDSVLTTKYQSVDMDTNYITRPQTKWTLTGTFKMSGARIRAEGDENGSHFKSKLTAEYKTTISASVSYLGLSFNLSLNPAKILGKYHDYELGFRSYGRRFGFDIVYQDAHNFKGWHEVEGVKKTITTSEDIFKLRTLNVNAYYVFNHRRFSYPAAFSHTYIQRRSAGSFLLGASGQGQHGEVNRENAMSFKMTNIGIGAGYGYNYVPARGWLLHLSLLPTFIVYSHTSATINDTDFPMDYRFPEVIITGRGAVVRQIGNNKFAGLSLVYSYTNIGDRNNLSIRNQKWLAHLYFGFRL